MKVFVTGATGYIGGSIAEGLVAAGHQVSGLVRSIESAKALLLKDRGIEPVLGDLDDPETLATAALAADSVIHAANADHVARSARTQRKDAHSHDRFGYCRGFCSRGVCRFCSLHRGLPLRACPASQGSRDSQSPRPTGEHRSRNSFDRHLPGHDLWDGARSPAGQRSNPQNSPRFPNNWAQASILEKVSIVTRTFT
jgi:hypothetical protein